MEFHHLPDEIMLNIFGLLEYSDLQRLLFVNKQCLRIARTESLWKNQCEKHWALKIKKKETWRESFGDYYKEYGRYVHVYSKIAAAWDRLQGFLRENCPRIFESLKDGMSETAIDRAIERRPVQLPDSLRLFFRLCGGQNPSSFPGLFGSVASYFSENFFECVYVDQESNHIVPCGLDPEGKYLTDLTERLETETKPPYYTIAICRDYLDGSEICALLPTTEASSFQAPFAMPASYSIIGKFDTNEHLQKAKRKYHAVADSFEDWFLGFVEKTVTGSYPVQDGHILRYNYKPECVARTGHITVRAGWAQSHLERSYRREKMIFEYRITMEMDKDAPESESCQLMERHWFIENFSDGSEERVSGGGVVGQYPIMRPGVSFSWTSRTSFDAPGGSMTGYFTMQSLRNSEKSKLLCPKYIMDVPHIYGL